MDIYLQGLTMGLAYVAPIGLQNLFVINTHILIDIRAGVRAYTIVYSNSTAYCLHIL